MSLPSLPSLSARASQDAASPPARGRARSVLVVEDDPLVASVLDQALHGAGHRVEVAASGRAALALVDSGRFLPEVLVTDLGLGDVSGLEVARDLRRSLPGLEVIVTSGYAGLAAPPSALARQGYRFLPKPFGARVLLDLVERGRDRA